MTRDEAIQKVNQVFGLKASGDALVDALAALGVLKLEEPKGPGYEVWLATMISQDYPDDMPLEDKLKLALSHAKLKIVPKSCNLK